MELRHLRYFAVGKLLSFSRAAVQLHIAQPSLSVRLRDETDAASGGITAAYVNDAS